MRSDSDIRRDVQLFKREHGPSQGKDYADLNDDQLTDDYHYTIFPNISVNVHSDDVMLFRQRPHATDPNKMYYDIWLFELVAEGEEWPERVRHQHFFPLSLSTVTDGIFFEGSTTA